ncbi:MAG: amino acid ABC transporter substrate-binding protein [Deltaproteobacteria bacterium]|nr:amino acid ABC transporter substrate-binding protein [Deltaproteobacteria bacterium]
MCRTRKMILAGMFLFLITMVMNEHGNCEEAKTLTLATGEYAPYTSAEMEGYGLMTEIVSATVKEMGFEPEYVFHPWRRCENSVREGRIWATFPYGLTEERAKNFFFSDVLLVTSTKFFYSKKHQKQKITWETLEDLKPYKIGGVLGYYYEKEFQQAGLNVEYTDTEEFCIKMLRFGRIDLFPQDVAVGWALIKKYFPEEIENFGVLDKAHETSGYYLMVSKTYPKTKDLLQKFNAALKRIKQHGVIERIVQKYHLSDD